MVVISGLLRIFVRGVVIEHETERALFKLLLIVKEGITLNDVKKHIEKQYSNLYSSKRDSISVQMLQDINGCDLDWNFLINQVVENEGWIIAQVKQTEKTIPWPQLPNRKRTNLEAHIEENSLTSVKKPKLRTEKEKAIQKKEEKEAKEEQKKEEKEEEKEKRIHLM